MDASGYVLDLRIERLESAEDAEDLLREIIALVEQRDAQVTGFVINEREEAPEGG